MDNKADVLRQRQKKPSRGRPGKEAQSSSQPASSPPVADGQTSVAADECRLMISQAAYFLAEQRGFAPGHDVEDWLAAEQRIKRS